VFFQKEKMCFSISMFFVVFLSLNNKTNIFVSYSLKKTTEMKKITKTRRTPQKGPKIHQINAPPKKNLTKMSILIPNTGNTGKYLCSKNNM